VGVHSDTPRCQQAVPIGIHRHGRRSVDAPRAVA